jgi:dTDP-4-dehydrorhamnose reductase
MKILITGSGGMLGQELCRTLSQGGDEVAGLDITVPDNAAADPDLYNASINDAEAVERVFSDASPDIVIHAAAWADVDACEKDPGKARKVNVEGTANIVKAAEKISAPLIYISTDFVFDGKKNSPYTETDECDPLSVYAKTKREGEEIGAGILKDHAIVRTSWLFGPGGRNFVDAIVAKASVGNVIKVVKDQVGSPTYTKDLAQAIKELIKAGIKGDQIYHICNSGQCSWYELAAKVKGLVPEMENVIIDPVLSADIGRPASRPAFSVMDTSKFRKRTGMALRSWEMALSEYLFRR